MLRITPAPGTVQVAIGEASAVDTARDNLGPGRMIHLHCYALIKDVTLSGKLLTLHLRVLPVTHDSTVQLEDVFKTLPQEVPTELLATNPARAVGQDFLACKDVAVCANPFGQITKTVHRGKNRTLEMTQFPFILVTGINEDDVIIVHQGTPLTRRKMLPGYLAW